MKTEILRNGARLCVAPAFVSSRGVRCNASRSSHRMCCAAAVHGQRRKEQVSAEAARSANLANDPMLRQQAAFHATQPKVTGGGFSLTAVTPHHSAHRQPSIALLPAPPSCCPLRVSRCSSLLLVVLRCQSQRPRDASSRSQIVVQAFLYRHRARLHRCSWLAVDSPRPGASVLRNLGVLTTAICRWPRRTEIDVNKA